MDARETGKAEREVVKRKGDGFIVWYGAMARRINLSRYYCSD
jgi:hypothetical protein